MNSGENGTTATFEVCKSSGGFHKTITFDSLQGLLQRIDSINCEVIIGMQDASGGRELEIYDCYRE
jgi:hypothetical protein